MYDCMLHETLNRQKYFFILEVQIDLCKQLHIYLIFDNQTMLKFNAFLKEKKVNFNLKEIKRKFLSKYREKKFVLTEEILFYRYL